MGLDWDKMANRRIEDLHPNLIPLCEQFLENCLERNLNIRVIFTYRMPVEQDVLYNKGRTRPGSIVTNLRGNQSKHCFTIEGQPAAKAFDFGVFENDGSYQGNGKDIRYVRAGIIGEQLGLRWGGRWKSPFDPSHLELIE